MLVDPDMDVNSAIVPNIINQIIAPRLSPSPTNDVTVAREPPTIFFCSWLANNVLASPKVKKNPIITTGTQYPANQYTGNKNTLPRIISNNR